MTNKYEHLLLQLKSLEVEVASAPALALQAKLRADNKAKAALVLQTLKMQLARTI